MEIKHSMPSGTYCRQLSEVVTADKESRTIEVVWSTGYEGFRRGWEGGYYESLSLRPEHVDLSRLKNGAPVLNTHDSWDLRSVIGVVEDAWLVSDTEARARIRLSDREEIRGTVNDILEGIIRNVSVGYTVRKLVEVGRRDDYPILRAEDWQPFELSFVPVPFDAGATSRSNEKESDCTIILNEEGENRMSAKKDEPVVTAPAPTQSEIDAQIRLAVEAEQTRVIEINSLVDKTGLARSHADQLIREKKTVDEARAYVIDHLHEANKETRTSPVTAGDLQEKDTLVRAIEETIILRSGSGAVQPTELSQRFSSHSFLDMARAFLEAQGVRTSGMSRNHIAGQALQFRGLHTTSDFPGILGSAVKKILAAQYQTAPQDYDFLVRKIGMTDYKAVNRYSLSQGPALLEVKEHGEYTRGSLAEKSESMQLKKFGRILGVTREMIINDDLGAFNDIPRMWAFGASQLQENLVWNQLLLNPIMGDGNALFSVAHANLQTGAALSETTLQTAITALETQTGFSAPGEDIQYMSLKAKYLVVGPAQKYAALKLVSPVNATQASNVNLFTGLEVKVNPRITGNKWFVTADKNFVDIIGLMYMIGEEGPQLDERQGFDVDGVEFKVRLDTGAQVLDYRGLVYNPGA